MIGWMTKNNRAARTAPTLTNFFDVDCELQIEGLKDNMNTQQ